MKTIHFEQNEQAAGGSPDCIVPARGTRLFIAYADVPLRLKSVHVSSKSARAEDSLSVISVLVADLNATEGSGFDSVFRSFPVKGKTIEGVRKIDVVEPFMVLVANDSDEPLEARPTVTGVGTIDGGEVPPNAEEFFVAMTPRPSAKARRIRVPAKGGASVLLTFPCACEVRRITTRSDSKLDVDITDLRLANVSLTVSGAVPVEFFQHGVDIKTFRALPSNRMAASLQNRGDEDRYVEIDVGIASVKAERPRGEN